MSIDTRLSTIIIPLIEFLIPIACFSIACCLQGYTAYAFADPFGIWLVGAIFLWNCIGLALAFVFQANYVRIVVGAVFSLPVSIFIFFLPAAVNALHTCAK